MFDHLEKYFKALKNNVPARGYFPEPTKRILVAHPQNLKTGEGFGWPHGLKFCTGARYLGGYTGDDKTKGGWLKERMEKWEIDIRALIKMAYKYPQESCATMTRGVQL